MSEHVVHTQLRKNALGVAGIVFLVLAAVAPLTGIVVVASLVIALGNGGGSPVSFFVVAIVLLFFAVGYAQMSKQLVNAGGFYAFVVKGLGRTGGLIAGFIATLGYNFFVVGTIGTSGFFMQLVISDLTGFNLHWYAWGLLSIIVSFVMARRGVDFSSKVLGVSLVLETSILVVFDISVLVKTGFDVSAFSPAAVFSGSLPIGLLLAATGTSASRQPRCSAKRHGTRCARCRGPPISPSPASRRSWASPPGPWSARRAWPRRRTPR